MKSNPIQENVFLNKLSVTTSGIESFNDNKNLAVSDQVFLQEKETADPVLQKILEQLPAALYTTDKNGFITFYNNAAVELWGRKPEIGKDRWCGSFKIFELDGITEVPLEQCPMALILRQEEILNEPLILERPDGTRKFFLSHPELIRDSEDNIMGAINLQTDVTELRLDEEQKARLAAIVHSSNDAIISKTLTSIITSWNEGAERIFGYKAEEMIGESIYKLIPPDRKDEEAHILKKLRNGELIDHYQTKRLTKDGRLLDISLTISPIKDSKGNIIGASKIARDITLQKEAEQLLLEKEEHLRMALEEQKLHEKRKDDFIKIASHELKTPVTSINGYVQLLMNIYNGEQQKDDNATAIIKTSLNTISKQVAKLTRLIADLLDLSKIESGKLALYKTEFNIEELVDEAVQEARGLTTKHAIIFRSDFEGKITGDKDRIGQVLANLLNNAIKYSPNSDKVDVVLSQESKFIYIDVIDYGIGIEPKNHQKIFERFYRVEGKEEQTYPGFGIGLFISREIVRRHQGTLTVKSEKNKGSVFTLSLPLLTTAN